MSSFTKQLEICSIRHNVVAIWLDRSYCLSLFLKLWSSSFSVAIAASEVNTSPFRKGDKSQNEVLQNTTKRQSQNCCQVIISPYCLFLQLIQLALFEGGLALRPLGHGRRIGYRSRHGNRSQTIVSRPIKFEVF